jgi:PadR family transcriptional regulator, regulatory protein PadR
MSTIEHHDLLAGLVRLHILHHAAKHEIYGQWMIDELARHGYKLSPGTLYPMLHAMEKKGYLSCRRLREGRTVRMLYSATEFGKAGLVLAKIRLRELTGEAMRAKTNAKEKIGQKANDRRRAKGPAAAKGLAAMR